MRVAFMLRLAIYICDDRQALSAMKNRFGWLARIEIEIVYNMYRMRRFTTITVCAG
jgi:hypothetical protein